MHTLQALARSLIQRGEAPALLRMSPAGTEQWTYGELGELTGRMAAGLIAAGLSPGDRGILFAPNSPEWVVACLALLEAGAVPVPVDSQVTPTDLQHILADCGANWVFTTTNSIARLPAELQESLPRIVSLDTAGDHGLFWRELLATSGSSNAPIATPNDCAMLFYTSGTTGTPKGVPLSHANIATNMEAILSQRITQPGDRLLLPLPLHHVYPFVVGLMIPLREAMPVIMPRSLTGAHLQQAIYNGQASILLGVPRLYVALLSAIEQQLEARGQVVSVLFRTLMRSAALLRSGLRVDVGKWLFVALRKRFGPRLRLLVSGGSALPPEVAWALEGLGWRVATGYGLTETSPILTFNAPGTRHLANTGRPLPNVTLRIAPPEPGFPHGEVLAKGPNVFAGYRNLPEQTAGVFTGDGWFRTGDLGYIDNGGYLHLTGRASAMIVLPGGENVDPEGLEAALAEAPSIQEVGVLEDNGKLVGVVVPEAEPARELDDDALLRRVNQELAVITRDLPSYQRLNDVIIDQVVLPRTRLGKLRRHILRDRYAALRAGRGGAKQTGLLPLRQLAPEDRQLLEDAASGRLWRWLGTRFPDDLISPDTDLRLDLGVDSMDWLNLSLEIRDVAGVELDAEIISRIETVRDLLHATVTGEQAAGDTEDLVTRLRVPDKLLSPSQRSCFEPPSFGYRLLGRVLELIGLGLMRYVYRLRVTGAENLPATAPFILAPNHRSSLDPVTVGFALGHARLPQTYWAGWVGMMFERPLMRQISRAGRVLPIETERGALASLELAAATLHRGYNLVWFPEGRRSLSGELQPFLPGIGLLLQAQPVPVVPIWIEGTQQALPPGRLWFRRARLSITLGPPVSVDELETTGLGDTPAERIVDALRTRVAALGGARAGQRSG
ncbi:MAG: AMP-binding protein [Gammaproteobacteria bacterium]|nr:AMP-binding protein [Gammaproteobacteria bacterium]